MIADTPVGPCWISASMLRFHSCASSGVAGTPGWSNLVTAFTNCRAYCVGWGNGTDHCTCCAGIEGRGTSDGGAGIPAPGAASPGPCGVGIGLTPRHRTFAANQMPTRLRVHRSSTARLIPRRGGLCLRCSGFTSIVFKARRGFSPGLRFVTPICAAEQGLLTQAHP